MGVAGRRTALCAKLKAAATIVLTVGTLATVGAGVLAQGQRQASQPASLLPGRHEDIGRTIRFPDEVAVGIIYVLDTDEHELSAIRGYDRWQRIGEARGVVRLPARGLVRLDVSRSAVADLSPLQQLDPQAIQVLCLRDLARATTHSNTSVISKRSCDLTCGETSSRAGLSSSSP